MIPLKPSGYPLWYKTYSCGVLQPNTTYSIQCFYPNDFIGEVRVGVSFNGAAPTQAPKPILSTVPASNQLGVLNNNGAGVTTIVSDNFGSTAAIQ